MKKFTSKIDAADLTDWFEDEIIAFENNAKVLAKEAQAFKEAVKTGNFNKFKSALKELSSRSEKILKMVKNAEQYSNKFSN